MNLIRKREGKDMKYESPYKNVNKEEVICLATNENPYPLPDEIINEISAGLHKTNRYPKVVNEELKELIAKRHNVKAENVVLGAGSDEMIVFLSLCFIDNDKESIMADPSFFRYKQATEMARGKCKLVKCVDFKHDRKEMLKNITEQVKLVFICNPNNPTGTFLDIEEIEEFMQEVPAETNVVVDEAYFEFVYPKTKKSAIRLIEKYKNLIVLRTFSKYFGLASLRIGYAIADESIIKKLESLRSPYNVNTLAQMAATAVLKSPQFFDQDLYNEIVKERSEYYKEFKKLGLEYYESQANFVFVRLGEEVIDKLKERNIIIRPCRMFGFPEFARITIGTQEENSKLFKALEEVL